MPLKPNDPAPATRGQPKRGLRACAPIVLASVLAGCAAVGPDYRPPQPVTPAAWTQHAGNPPVEGIAPAEAPDRVDWWTRFEDPLLTELVTEALAGSPDLRAAVARLDAARAQRDLATAGFAPTVGAGASVRDSRSRGADSTNYQVGLDASWELDLFGRLRRGAEAANADLEASAATLGSARVTLAAEVALTYIDLRALQARLDVAQRNLATQEETLQLTEWRAQAGLVGSLDVEQARANVETTRAQLPALLASLGETRHRLAVLTGQSPTALDARLAAAAPIPGAPYPAALAIPAEVLRQRPDVHAAERTLAAETARVGEAQAARYPGLNLSASLGLEALTLGALTSGGDTVRSLAASLAATVFDAGRLRLQVEIRSAVQAQALADYEATVLTALEEVENALLAIATSRERRVALVAAVEAARNAALLARQRYASGLVDFQSVIDSARTVLSAEDSLATTEADGSAAMVRLYKALGGGWAASAS